MTLTALFEVQTCFFSLACHSNFKKCRNSAECADLFSLICKLQSAEGMQRAVNMDDTFVTSDMTFR